MLTSRELKELQVLYLRRNRARTGRFVAEGIRLVEDLIDSRIRVRWVATASSIEDSNRGRELIDRIDSAGVLRRSLSDRDFDRISGTDAPQGVIAVAEIPDARIEDLGEARSAGQRTVVLVLDAIQDPGNLGTMIRSAEAFAAAAVILLPGSVDPWNPKVVRSAAGSSFRIPIMHGAWPEVQAYLKQRDFEILGAASGAPPLVRGAARTALVLGNEGSGLSPDVQSSVDRLVGIPTPGRAESLNVTAAAAILLYGIRGQ